MDFHDRFGDRIVPLLHFVAIVILLAGCSSSNMDRTPGPTPNNYGGTPTTSGLQMPRNLNCSLITSDSPGPTWRQLTIGETKYGEIMQTLKPVQAQWVEFYGNMVFESRKPLIEQEWSRFEACFSGDILSAINVLGDQDQPEFLEGWLAIYGEPDHVTWGNDYFERSLIWFNEGILVVIELPEERRRNVMYFSPIPQDEVEANWLIQSLPKEGQEYPGPTNGEFDFCCDPLPKKLNVENPWGFGE